MSYTHLNPLQEMNLFPVLMIVSYRVGTENKTLTNGSVRLWFRIFHYNCKMEDIFWSKKLLHSRLLSVSSSKGRNVLGAMCVHTR